MDIPLAAPAPAPAADRDRLAIPLLRAELVLRARRAVELPELFGDSLRSAFGWALKTQVCIQPQRTDCLPCPVRPTCAYGALYEPLPPVAALHPSFTEGIPAYVLDPPGFGHDGYLYAGDAFNCGITLLPGHRLTPGLLALAARHAITGNRRLLGEALALDRIVISEPQLAWPPGDTPDPGLPPTRVQILFETPLSMKKNSQPLLDPALLQATDLSRLLWRRVQQIAQLARLPLPDGTPYRDAFGQLVLDARGLRSSSHRRAPRGGQRKHPLAGLVGPLALHGSPSLLARVLPLLRFCQPLHLGRHTVFGLGRYGIEQG